MPKINFGNVTNIGGQTVMTGVGSGYDTKEIIEGLKAAKEIPIKQMEDKISVNQKKIQAFNDLKDKAEIFQETANALRSIPSVDKSGNAFDSRTTNITTDNALPASSYADIVVDKGADITSYTLRINSTAKAHTMRSGSFTSESTSVTEAGGGTTAGMFSAGTITINGVNININQGDSLVEIKSSINAVSNQTNVTASIVQVSSTDFRFVLQSSLTGIANAINITDATGVLTQANFTTTQPAQDASFIFNGITMTRTSNTFDDVVENVNFNLKQPTDVGKTIYFDVQNSIDDVKAAIRNFVGAYNDIMLFVSKQQELDEDFKLKDTAVLGNDPTLRIMMQTMMSELSSYVKGVSSGYITLGEVGLKFIDYEGDEENIPTNNILQIDDAVLDNALRSNFDDVKRVFEFKFNSTSKTLLNTGRTNALNVTKFDINIDIFRPVGDQVRVTYIDSSGNTQNINADYDGTPTTGVIKGKSGTVLEGLSLFYVGSGTDTSSITLTQGIADRLYNYLIAITKDNGDISTAINSIVENQTRYKEEIIRKQEEVDNYVEKMKIKFGTLEQMINSFNTTIMFLEAQMNTRRD